MTVVTITLDIGQPSQLVRAQPQDQQQPCFDNPAISMQNCPAQNAWGICFLFRVLLSTLGEDGLRENEDNEQLIL